MSTTRTWSAHVFIATSGGGYIARPDGDLDWLTEPPAHSGHVPAQAGPDAPPGYEDSTASVTHLVMGRATYETVATFEDWPYAAFRTDVDERVTVVASLEQAVALLDAERAGKVYLDGGQTITRAPVVLGAGLPLFGDLPHPLRLVHLGTSTTENGMTSTRYRVTTGQA